MRAPLVVLVLLSACSTIAGPEGPPGPQGAPADPAVLAMLASKVAALEAELAAVRPVKVPWFVDGETKEPIGRVLDYSGSIAWNDDLGAPVPAVPTPVYFAEADCKGEPRVYSVNPRYRVLPDGSIVDVPAGLPGDFVVASMLDVGKPCRNESRQIEANYRRVVSTGFKVPPVQSGRLVVEMR
jgi:hypothetical protein